jgi:hypothetical protein
MVPSSPSVALTLVALAWCASVSAQQGSNTCPAEFDQTYEWDDAGFLSNGMREALLPGGIANDPGPNALEKGRRRVILSGSDHVVIEEVESWLIEPNEAAIVAGQRPFARARKMWKRTYAAAIGSRTYLEEETSEQAPRREVASRVRTDSRAGGPTYDGGPAPLHPSLAAEGTSGFSRGLARSVLGFRCVDQTWRPGDTGPVDERCVIDVPERCSIARNLDAMTLQIAVASARSLTITHRGRTTALKLGAQGKAVDRKTLVPPASLRSAREPTPDASPPR